MNIALIIAGGHGNRMGQSVPKQFLHIDGCPVIIHTMMAFQQHPGVDFIAVVCLRGWESVVQSYALQYGISKLRWVFTGGETGMESIHNGIYGLRDSGCSDDDLVLIHDGVRPLLSQEIISNNIATCMAFGNAITGIRCREAILESKDGLASKNSVPRDSLVRTQTPQTFRLNWIIGIHDKAREKGITNSVSSCTLIAELGEDIEMHIVPGEERNMKITTLEDIEIVKALLKSTL